MNVIVTFIFITTLYRFVARHVIATVAAGSLREKALPIRAFALHPDAEVPRTSFLENFKLLKEIRHFGRTRESREHKDHIWLQFD